MSNSKQHKGYLIRRDLQEDEHLIPDVLRRTSGTKPFKLAKLRSHRKISQQLLNTLDRFRHQVDPEVEYRTRDLCLQLLVKKKTLIKTLPNQKLQSQRKTLVYNDQIDQKFQSQAQLDGQPFLNEALKSAKLPLQAHVRSLAQTSEEFQQEQRPQIQEYLNQSLPEEDSHQAINLCTQKNSPKLNSVYNPELRQQLIQIKQKADKSPFAFTNIKWRTKSQLFQVDKWKQKYGSPPSHPLPKTKSYSKKIEHSTRPIQKSKNPTLMKLVERKSFPPISTVVESSKTLQSDQMARKLAKEMNQKIMSKAIQKSQKTKSKKRKPPAIQGQTIRSIRKQGPQRRLAVDLSPPKFNFALRQRLPRKIFFSKMQDIPERWQYRQSRDSSREVDAYLLQKEEEERQQALLRLQEVRQFDLGQR